MGTSQNIWTLLDNSSKNNCVIWLLLCCHTWNWSGKGRTVRRFWSSIITCKFLKKFVKFWTWFFPLLYVLSPVFVYVRQNMSTRADLRGLWRLIITCQLPILQKIRKILNLTFPPLLSHFAGQLLAGFCLCQNWSKYVEKS